MELAGYCIAIILSIIVFIVCCTMGEKFDESFYVLAFIAAVVFTLFSTKIYEHSEEPDTYYAPAERLAENETSTYFGTVDGHIYAIETDPRWADDVPYLLHMGTGETDSPADDEILVVWRTN